MPTVKQGLLMPYPACESPGNVVKRLVAPMVVKAGDGIYGDPVTGQIDKSGRATFFGIAWGGCDRPDRTIVILASGLLDGFSVDHLAIGTPFYQGEDPEQVSEIPSLTRPDPIARVVADPGPFLTRQRRVVAVYGHVG